jgi:hypothetical protein
VSIVANLADKGPCVSRGTKEKMASYVVLGLASLHGVRAWGVLGHATVAYVAQNFVTAEVATWAKGVLGDTSTSYLANIASWADTYRATTAGAWSGESLQVRTV